jgi:hypothetical protein
MILLSGFIKVHFIGQKTGQMVKSYTAKQLLDRVKSLGNYHGIPSGHWILGVRSNEDTANSFDDKFYLFHGEEFIWVTSGTTNPGTPTLKQFEKVNKNGAAVLKSDQWYYDVWKFGKHNGKVDALLQLGAAVQVYRDTDKDDDSEEQGKLDTGYFGINFHPNTYDLSKPSGTSIGWWSAGCQVVNNVTKYKEFIKLCKPQKFTSYCLINEF